jgi:hypothetical protein
MRIEPVEKDDAPAQVRRIYPGPRRLDCCRPSSRHRGQEGGLDMTTEDGKRALVGQSGTEDR